MLSTKFVFKQTLKHVLKISTSFSQVNVRNIRYCSGPLEMFRVLTILSKFGVQMGDKILIIFYLCGELLV